jgi:hypothetical protein
MMKEIYDWFNESMKHTDIEVHGMTHRPPATPNPAPPPTTFEVCLSQDMGETRLVCSRASLHERWSSGVSKENLVDQYHLFTCHCSLSSGATQGDHSSALSIYACECSPFDKAYIKLLSYMQFLHSHSLLASLGRRNHGCCTGLLILCITQWWQSSSGT